MKKRKDTPRTNLRWEWIRQCPKWFIVLLTLLHFPLSLLIGVFDYGLRDMIPMYWSGLKEMCRLESVQKYNDWKVLIPALRESQRKYRRRR